MKLKIRLRKGWIARDTNGSIWWYSKKPTWDQEYQVWSLEESNSVVIRVDGCIDIDMENLPQCALRKVK